MSNGLSSGPNFSIGCTTTGCKSVVHAFNSRSELNVFELGQIPRCIDVTDRTAVA